MAKTKMQKFLKEYNYLKSCLRIKEPGELAYDWQFNTDRTGTFLVSMFHTEDEKRVGLYSIFGRFYDVDKGRAIYFCNPNSGKYNFHAEFPTNCLEEFQNFIEDSTGIKIDRNYLDKDNF